LIGEGVLASLVADPANYCLYPALSSVLPTLPRVSLPMLRAYSDDESAKSDRTMIFS
jgi:hypothetical protein